MYQREGCQRFRKKIAQKVFGGLLINESSRLAHMMNRVRVHPPFIVLMMVSAFLFLTATLGRTIEPTDREAKAQETAVLAGGCFWDVDAVFKHVKGVSKVISGYSGGNAATSEYELVSAGTTGHAESVEVIYDPSVISYSEL